jgi:hypothetical protein
VDGDSYQSKIRQAVGLAAAAREAGDTEGSRIKPRDEQETAIELAKPTPLTQYPCNKVQDPPFIL